MYINYFHKDMFALSERLPTEVQNRGHFFDIKTTYISINNFTAGFVHV